MKTERYLEVVGSRPKPGKEKEYIAWYHKHIADMCKFKGCRRVRLSRLYQPLGEKGAQSPRYVTIYEFESKEAIAEFYKDYVMPSAGGQLKDDLLPASVEMLWAGYYEPVETVENVRVRAKGRKQQ